MQNDNKVLLPHLTQTTENISASSAQNSGQTTQSFNSNFIVTVADSGATELSGPRFHEKTQKTEKSYNNGWGGKIKNTLKKKKSVIVAFGIILTSIVGGVLLASTLNSGTESLQSNLTAAVNTETVVTTNNTSTLNITSESATGEITQTASYGEGTTHLARKAVSEYLAVSGVELNAEQKIYAEDYLRKATGSQSLEEGDVLIFAASNIKSAVDASLALQEWQLNNLSQYTQNVQL
ncbi:MAG: hypothetical protein WDZ40_03945 [Candidatus Spechtbacterales bacterium]